MSSVVHTHAQVVTDASVEAVFDSATDSARFQQFFTGFGPIPGVVAVTWLTSPPAAGGRRSVKTVDGATIEETVIELARPHSHHYEIPGGFPAPFSWLVRSARAEWSFTTTPQGTSLRWDYSFKLTHPLALLVAAPLIKLFFKAAMQRCLNNISKSLRS